MCLIYASEGGSGGRQVSGCAQALWHCRGVGGPRADSARRSSAPGRRRHLPASACRRGPERLVRRTGTRLARLADLRHGSLVLVHPSGAFVGDIARVCDGLLHLRRAVPAAHPVQRSTPARRARAPRERGALPHSRAVLFRRVLGERRAAPLHPPGVRRTPHGRPAAELGDRQDALGDSVPRAGRRGVAQAPRDAGRALAVPRLRARASDARRGQALRVGFRYAGLRRIRAASSATAASGGTSPSASSPRRSTGRTSGSSNPWTGSTAPCRERTTSSR